MTVNDAIARASLIVGGSVSREMFSKWLTEIELTVIIEVAITHRGGIYDISDVDPNGDGNRVLWAPEPYSELYVNYLVMKSDLFLRDLDQYVNSSRIFAASYQAFTDWYNRTFMPVGETKIVL